MPESARASIWPVRAALLMTLAACKATNPGTTTTMIATLRDTIPEAIVDRAWGSLAWTDDGRLLLVDASAQQVLLLTPKVWEVVRIGRRGSGPGEFTGAAGVSACGDRFAVADMMARRVSMFSMRGELLHSWSVSGALTGQVACAGDSVATAWIDMASGLATAVGQGTPASPVVTPLFLPTDSYPALSVNADPTRGASPQYLAVAFGPGLRSMVGNPITYALACFDRSGKLVAELSRTGLHPREPSEEEREARRNRMNAMLAQIPGDRAKEFADRVSEAEAAPMPFFTATGIALDGEGRAWVAEASEVAESTKVEVVGPDGRVVGALMLRDRVRAIAVRGTALAVIVERDDSRLSLGPVDIYDVAEGR